MNPLGTNSESVNLANPAIQGIAETLQLARSFQSPQAFIQELQKQNPEMAHYLMTLARTIQNPLATAHQLLAQRGITPHQINWLLAPH
jgi:hypothetical protein